MPRFIANCLHLGLKELASLCSDTVLALFIVYSFTFAVYNEAIGIRMEIADAPVAVVDADRSMLSARLRDALAPPYFRPPVLLDRSEVERAMEESRYSFVLDLPPHFEADLLAGRSPALQLHIDATAMTHAGVGAADISTILEEETRRYLSPARVDKVAPVTTAARALFNPNLEGVWFQSVMSVIENVTMLAILLVGAAVMREREHGTIEHLLTMPVRAGEIALAKIWANGLVVLLGAAVSLYVVVDRLLAVPIGPSIPLFLGGTALYLYAIAALGLLLATIANSMPQYALLTIPVFLSLTMLSGAGSPLEAMPEPIRLAVQISPSVHYVKFAQSVLYRGAGVGLVWSHLAVLSAIGTVFLALALSRFRSMLGRLA